MRFLLCLLIAVSPAATAQYEWDGVERVVAIGDVHGAHDALVELLQATGVIDAQLSWSGGETHLVSIGDLLDRGPDSRKAMDLLMRLQQEAPQANGRVHVVLGNHEVMNLTGDLRDVSEAEKEALVDLGGHAGAFSLDGSYGRWLIGLPFMIRINDTAFAHGGFPSVVGKLGLAAVNANARAALRTVLVEGRRLRDTGFVAADIDLMIAAADMTEEERASVGTSFLEAVDSPLLGAVGPLWYRGTAACHALLERAPLERTRAALGVTRVVMGHTPTPDREINRRMDGAAYIIDTGMLAAYYRGRPRALEIRGETIRGIGIDGDAVITNLPARDPLEVLRDVDAVGIAEPRGMINVKLDHAHLAGRFVKLPSRDAARAEAAFRLDRILGLHMVPATVQRTVAGQKGILMAWPDRSLSEARRQERGQGRPQYCETASDFALVQAFDALLGKRDRSPESLHYNGRTWEILLTENHGSFGTSTRLPAYAQPPTLPAAMAAALAALDLATLERELAELIKSRELKALLKRRDAVLKWPRQGDSA